MQTDSVAKVSRSQHFCRWECKGHSLLESHPLLHALPPATNESAPHWPVSDLTLLVALGGEGDRISEQTSMTCFQLQLVSKGPLQTNCTMKGPQRKGQGIKESSTCCRKADDQEQAGSKKQKASLSAAAEQSDLQFGRVELGQGAGAAGRQQKKKKPTKEQLLQEAVQKQQQRADGSADLKVCSIIVHPTMMTRNMWQAERCFVNIVYDVNSTGLLYGIGWQVAAVKNPLHVLEASILTALYKAAAQLQSF